MSKSRDTHAPPSVGDPEQARDLRARAWAYVFSRYEANKKAGVRGAGDEAKGPDNARPKGSIPQ